MEGRFVDQTAANPFAASAAAIPLLGQVGLPVPLTLGTPNIFGR
jgi:hypothetical protein